MTELSDYQKRVAKMQQWNRFVMLCVTGTIALLFIILLGVAIWQGQKRQDQTKVITDYITKQREVTSAETRINREGGDIIRCLLLIINTVEPPDRTQAMVDSCYPGGSKEAWEKRRAEVLGDE